MDWPLTPVDQIRDSPLEEPRVRKPRTRRHRRARSKASHTSNDIIFGEEIQKSLLLPHHQSNDLGDVNSIQNRISELSVAPVLVASIQCADRVNGLTSHHILESPAPRNLEMDPQHSTAQGSSKLPSRYPAIFADRASESLMVHPLKLNHPGVTISRPAHLSWLDDPRLFANMLQDKYPDNENLNNNNSELSGNQVPKKEAPGPILQTEAGDAAMFGAFPKQLQAVLAASHRLQTKLGIDNPNTRPNQPRPSNHQISPDSNLKNATLLRETLSICSNFAVDTNRKSENKQFLDEKVLAFEVEDNKEVAKNQDEVSASKASEGQGQVREFKGPSNIVMINSKVNEMSRRAWQDNKKIPGSHNDMTQDMKSPMKKGDEAIQNKGSASKDITKKKKSVVFSARVSSLSNAQAKIPSTDDMESGNGGQDEALLSNVTETQTPRKRVMVAEKNTSTSGKGIKNSGKAVWPTIAVPEPSMMPNTFTNAICQQKQFNVTALLTLTLIDTGPLMPSSSINRGGILLHLEVGLDGVEAICQGDVMMKESTYWKEDVYEKRLGNLGTANSGDEINGKGLDDNSNIDNGKRSGMWIFFGLRFKQTDEENASAKGGKWACWGFPKKGCLQIEITKETARYGGATDGEGVEVPECKANVNRIEFLSSFGGLAGMDLWEGADEWKEGVWGKIKNSIARNGLKTSFLLAAKQGEKRRRRNKKSQGRKAKKVKCNPET